MFNDVLGFVDYLLEHLDGYIIIFYIYGSYIEQIIVVVPLTQRHITHLSDFVHVWNIAKHPDLEIGQLHTLLIHCNILMDFLETFCNIDQHDSSMCHILL